MLSPQQSSTAPPPSTLFLLASLLTLISTTVQVASSSSDDSTGVICNGVTCDSNAGCHDNQCTCKLGWTGNGTTCSDTDECSDPHDNVCNRLQSCVNTPGRFRCLSMVPCQGSRLVSVGHGFGLYPVTFTHAEATRSCRAAHAELLPYSLIDCAEYALRVLDAELHPVSQIVLTGKAIWLKETKVEAESGTTLGRTASGFVNANSRLSVYLCVQYNMYLCPARESEQSSSSTHLARPVALFADLQANSEARLDSHTYQTAHDLCQRSGMRLPDPSPDTTQCQQEFATWLRTEGISGVDGNSFWSAAGASSSALAEGTTTTFCEIPNSFMCADGISLVQPSGEHYPVTYSSAVQSCSEAGLSLPANSLTSRTCNALFLLHLRVLRNADLGVPGVSIHSWVLSDVDDEEKAADVSGTRHVLCAVPPRYYCKQTTLGLPPRYQQDWQNATFQDANTACQKAGMELPLADDAACVAAFLHRLELSFSSYSFTFPQSAWLHPGKGFGALDPVQSSDMTKRNQRDGLHVICDLTRYTCTSGTSAVTLSTTANTRNPLFSACWPSHPGDAFGGLQIAVPGQLSEDVLHCRAQYKHRVNPVDVARPYALAVCLIPSPSCSNSPCSSNGVCRDLDSGLGYACQCAASYTGTDCDNAGPVLSSPIGINGLVVSEDDGTKSAVLSMCINSTIKPAPSSANAVVWRTEASGGIGSGKVITSLNDSNGCFWSNLTVDISVVSEAMGDYTVNVTTSVGSTQKTVSLQINVPLCELPPIHYGHAQPSGLMNNRLSDGQRQTTTSSAYEVVCEHGFRVASLQHSKCELTSGGKAVFANVPDCHAAPVLSSPLEGNGSIVSEDDGSGVAVLSVCINSTIRPPPSSSHAVSWDTDASGWTSVFRDVHTSLNDSNGCFWSNLTVNIGVVAEAVGHYTVKVVTTAGYSKLSIPLHITVPLCELPAIHHGQARPTGVLSNTRSVGHTTQTTQTQTTTSSDYEVVCAEGLSVSSSQHAKCRVAPDGKAMYRDVPDCLALPVLSSPAGKNGLVLSEAQAGNLVTLSVCINSTIKPAPLSSSAIDWSTEASGGESVFRYVKTSLVDSHGCFWSNLTVNAAIVSPVEGDYTINVTTSAGSSSQTISLTVAVPTCDVPVIAHGTALGSGVFRDTLRQRSSHYNITCDPGFGLTNYSSMKCLVHVAGKSLFDHTPTCVEDALAVTSSTAVVAILAAVLSVIALLTFAGLLFKKKRGSQKIMSGGNTVSSGLRASASIYSTASKYLGGTPYETRMAMKPRAKHDSTGSSAFLVQDTTVYSMPESFKSVDFLSPSARSHLSTGELFQDYSDSETCYSDDDPALSGGPGDATVAAAAAAATAA
eukprot:scpid19895/ scgid6507/ Uromodulin; Tamm-Horsfall urinary glycoprotein; Uromodulin, secreted form